MTVGRVITTTRNDDEERMSGRSDDEERSWTTQEQGSEQTLRRGDYPFGASPGVRDYNPFFRDYFQNTRTPKKLAEI